MFKHTSQKIWTAILLIAFLILPLSGIFPTHKAEAVDKQQLLNGVAAGVGTYYVSACTVFGKALGLSSVISNLTDFATNLGGSVLDAVGGAVGGFLGGIPVVGGFLQGAVTGNEDEDSSSAGDSVPVNVVNLPASVDQKLKDTQISSTKSTQDAICDTLNRAISQVVKQQILNQLANDVMDWVKRGYKGKVIVSNWQDLVNNAGQAAVGQFAQEIGAGFLCSPFNLQVQIALRQPERFDTRAKCTLNDIVNNLNNFYTNFRSGDWINYQTVWEPANNYYGATILAWNEQTHRVAAAKLADSSEAQAGGGFLSQKNCVQVTLPNGRTTEKCTVTSPGILIGNAAAEVLVKTPLGSILTAEELSGYVEAIVTTAINELIKNQVDQLKQGF